jgi:hypothetical protein
MYTEYFSSIWCCFRTLISEDTYYLDLYPSQIYLISAIVIFIEFPFLQVKIKTVIRNDEDTESSFYAIIA